MKTTSSIFWIPCLERNTARDGGGIFILNQNLNLLIRNVTYLKNLATRDGGGLLINSNKRKYSELLRVLFVIISQVLLVEE